MILHLCGVTNVQRLWSGEEGNDLSEQISRKYEKEALWALTS